MSNLAKIGSWEEAAAVSHKESHSSSFVFFWLFAVSHKLSDGEKFSATLFLSGGQSFDPFESLAGYGKQYVRK